MYITNLEDDLRKNSTELYEEEGPKDKMPAEKIGLLKGPPYLILVMFPNCMKSLVVKMRTLKKTKRERIKNVKESCYTNTNEHKKKDQAELPKDEKLKYHHKIPRKNEKNEKALVTKEMALSNLGKNIL